MHRLQSRLSHCKCIGHNNFQTFTALVYPWGIAFSFYYLIQFLQSLKMLDRILEFVIRIYKGIKRKLFIQRIIYFLMGFIGFSLLRSISAFRSRLTFLYVFHIQKRLLRPQLNNKQKRVLVVLKNL